MHPVTCSSDLVRPQLASCTAVACTVILEVSCRATEATAQFGAREAKEVWHKYGPHRAAPSEEMVLTVLLTVCRELWSELCSFCCQ